MASAAINQDQVPDIVYPLSKEVLPLLDPEFVQYYNRSIVSSSPRTKSISPLLERIRQSTPVLGVKTTQGNLALQTSLFRQKTDI
jgi:hypothetical protein